MRRITPEEVRDAYAATGLVPARTGPDWLVEPTDMDPVIPYLVLEGTGYRCGCGLAAVYKADHPDFRNPYWPTGLMADALGISLLYLCGFVRGWEGCARGDAPRGLLRAADAKREVPAEVSARDYDTGYDDGRAAATLCLDPEKP